MKNTLKKTVAIIMSILVISAIPMSAFAAPGSGTPIGDQYDQEAFVYEKVSRYIEEEEPFWDYAPNHHYTDENGTVWAYWPGEKKNWIVSTENPEWMYRVLDDGTLYVKSHDGQFKDPVNVIVPSTLDGKQVTVLGAAAVSETLSVTIPDTVKEIDYHAFRNNSNLKRIVIGKGINSIEVEAFSLTDNLAIYYTGTEVEWGEVVVWNQKSTIDLTTWAVTEYNWLSSPYGHRTDLEPSIASVYFNVNPDELAPLVPEEEELTFWEKIIVGIANFIAKIIGFFKIK